MSNRLIAGGKDATGWRLPAEALEAAHRRITVAHLRKAAAGHDLVSVPDASGAAELVRRANQLADRIDAEPALLGRIIASGILAQGAIRLKLDAAEFASRLAVSVDSLAPALSSLTEPFALRRRGIETKIIAGERTAAPDPVLQRTLAEAHLWARALRAGTSLNEIARDTGRSEPYIRARIGLAFLAPDLQAAILEGRQPATVSVAQVLRDDPPMDWTAQRRLFRIG